MIGTVHPHCQILRQSARSCWPFALLALSACGGDSASPMEQEVALLTLTVPPAPMQTRAIDVTNVSVEVAINGASAIEAQRSEDGSWSVPRLRRADYDQAANQTVIVWSERVGGVSLLLAEFGGTFSLGDSTAVDAAIVDPVGTYISEGASRFDVDSDGFSNLAERTAIPPSDPFLQSSVPAAPLPQMVNVPTGCFDLGSPDTELQRDVDEGPQRTLCLNAFRIGKYEVTFAQYDVFADATGRERPNDSGWGRGNFPVINVSWSEATAYATWLSAETGQDYRLPNEAEWEYAARAGTTTAFHTGATITTDDANFDGSFTYNGSAVGTYRGQTTVVGSFVANAFGLHDVHGNVWEWTCSAFQIRYTGAEQQCDSDPANVRVLRGGSWFLGPQNMRSANRGDFSADDDGFDRGFRLLLQ